MRNFSVVPLAAVAWPWPAAADAAGPRDRDHVIEPETPSTNGAEVEIGPGDSVCVRGGEREVLRLYGDGAA
jgi:hypothetical protein